MSRKIRKAVASTLAIAMMAGNFSSMPALNLSSVVQAAEEGVTVTAVPSTSTVKPGDEFTVALNVTNNASGFHGLIAWLNFNNEVFEFKSAAYGKEGEIESNPFSPFKSNMDTSIVENASNPANISSLFNFYFDQSTKQLTGEQTLVRITFAVKDDAKSGDYTFDIDENAEPGKAKQNSIEVVDGKKQNVQRTPNYVDAKVTVSGGEVAETTTTTTTTTTTKTSDVTTSTSKSETTQATQPPAADGLQFIVKDAKANPGDMAIIDVEIKNNPGISAAQFAYKIAGTDLKFEMAAAGDLTGGWTLGDTYGLAQYTSDDGCNIAAKDGVLGKFAVTLPDDMKEGVYEIQLTELQACKYHEDIDKQVMIDKSTISSVSAYLTVGEGGEVVTQPTTQSTTQGPSTSEGFEVAVSDASGKVGENIKTTLNISKNPGVAGFTADLSFDRSALKLVSAKASGWDIEFSDEGKIVALANPYQDVTTTGAAVNLEFEALKEGDHKVGFNSVSAAKKSEVAVSGKGTAGTIKVGAGEVVAPNEDALKFIVKDTKANPGDMAIIDVELKNNPGISAAQFAYKIGDTGLKFEMAAAGDLTGGWTLGDTYGLAQYTSDDGCNIAAKDGVIGKFAVTLPADMKEGVYEITLSELQACKYHEDIDKQIMLDKADVAAVTGKLIVGDVDPDETTTTKVTTSATTTTKVTTTPPEVTGANPGENLAK